jgi:UDP-galactopyranose mutase
MRPYNMKVWATPPEQMSATWIGDRVSVVDYRRALRNVVLERDDVAWGPNNTFRFPKSGGTGEIYRRLARRLGDRVRFGQEVVEIDAHRRCLLLAGDAVEEYDALVTTMPLDRLVAAIEPCPGDVRAAATTLRHNGVRVVGVGYERPLLDERCWMYFPDPDVPFYRVTNFAKYSPANVPQADIGRCCSYLTETAYADSRRGDPRRLERQVTSGLVAAGVVADDAPISSLHTIDVEYAYPVPTLGRDPALAAIQPWLMANDIYARGRFGSWRYEIGNMDHAVKMGIDAARLLVEGRPEELWPS